MPPKKRMPMRMCVGCRQMKPKPELVRIVLTPQAQGAEICVDLKGKQNGRGAYVCRDGACLARAVKSRALERALSAPVPDEIYGRLAGQVLQDGETPAKPAKE